MSSPPPRKAKSHTEFCGATRHLLRYHRLIIASVICALFVGLAMTGSLTVLLPILRVLLNGQSVQDWASVHAVERRLDVRLLDQPDIVQIATLADKSPLRAAGFAPGEPLRVADAADVHAALHALADPASRTVKLLRSGGAPIDLALPAERWYDAALVNGAGRLPRNPIGAIAVIFAGLLCIALVGNTMRFLQEYLSDKAAVLAVNDIRRRLYDHVLHIPLLRLGGQGSSDLTSRLVQDSLSLESGFKTVLGQSIQEPIKATMALGLALIVSWKLTLFMVLFAPIMGVLIRKFGKKMRRASRAAMQKASGMLGQIESAINGIKVVKASGAERFERRRYVGIMAGLIDFQLRMSRIDALSAPVLDALTMLVVSGVVLFASYMVLVRHTLGVPSFILVLACLGSIADSLRRVNKVNNTLQQANAAAGRMFEALDQPVEIDRERRRAATSSPRRKLRGLEREVRFESVTFSYPGATTAALSNVSLTVERGQCVAIVGRNGSGKTTLAALLPRFYDPQEGRVSIDGVDLRDFTLRSLRGAISIVSQDSIIFPTTIAANIAYGQPLASRQRIVEAVRSAHAESFILEKPQGFDTVLGEMGGQLSGGQKQRLCIARAILRDSPILILDEATSQVDAESEHLIQLAIEKIIHQRTTFVIAHRLGTILSADVIVVMDRGQIVGQGTHSQLLDACPTYQQLYQRQLLGRASEAAGTT